ncbi:MAG TPA: CoA-binding protein [Thermomicrobiaceae bacterium]|nr:CoA-binding protein [Thermomicrobiaceae bacterium]
MSTSEHAGTQATPGATDVPARFQDEQTIREILRTSRTIAIVGLSSNVLRASNFVGFYLQRHGYRIVPVNPGEGEILGETSYPALTDIPFPVDVVDVFRRPDAVPDIARQAVRIGARVLWLQFGVISPEGAEIAERGGLTVVVDRCMKVEHARHLGRMHLYGLNTGVIASQRGRL